MATVSVTYPGLPAIVPSARRLVHDILASSPRKDDLELIAAELIANAIQHTSSGSVGGAFTIIVHTGNGWASIEVTDAGGSSWCPAPGDNNMSDEYGRGLMIVAALADRFGHDADEFGQTVWAEVSW
jgi:anti-sigma regulatory factor (Ser/Thr protein kinase)